MTIGSTIREFFFGKQEPLPKPVTVEVPKEVKHHVSNAQGRVVNAKNAVHPTTKHGYIAPTRTSLQADQKKEERRRKQRTEDDSSSSILGAVVAAEIISSAFDSSPSTDVGSASDFSFGGGDSGGGGASGSW